MKTRSRNHPAPHPETPASTAVSRPPDRGRSRRTALGILAVGLLLTTACRPPLGQIDWLRDGRTTVPQRFAVLFLVDGMSPDVTERMLEEGRLPHLERIFARGGVTVRNAVTAMPSVTYANTASILTGRFPGHHGILGNEWFDPTSRTWRDYRHATTYLDVNDDLRSTTLFDLLEDEFTINVQGHTHRGADVNDLRLVRSGWDWMLEPYSDVDRRVGRSARDIAIRAERAGRWPTLILLYFPGIDEIAHHRGSDGPAYEAALEVIDEAVGRFTDDLARLDLLDRCYLALVSDHGMTSTTARTDVAAWLRRHRGWVVRQEMPTLTRWFEGRMPPPGDEAICVESGGRCVHIHLPGADGWDSRPAAVAIETAVRGREGEADMRRIPGVHLVCTRDGKGDVQVATSTGTAALSRRTVDGVTQYALDVIEGATDEVRSALGLPLGVPPVIPAGRLDDVWLTSREWLAATAGGPHPDLVPQLVEMFDSPRAGDIVLFADERTTFHHCWQGAHGSTHRADMRIPLYFAGPDLPRGGEIPAARSIDLAPTLIDLLGFSDRLNGLSLDGHSLAPHLRTAPRGHMDPDGPGA